MTFARTVELTESWNQLRDSARALSEAEPGNQIQNSFYQRMLKSEARALKLPDISLYERTSNIDNLYTLIQCGIIIKILGPSVFHSTSEMFSFMLGLPFFN